MFRFSLRELFLIVICVSIGVGWWVDRGHFVKRCEHSQSSEESMRFVLSLHGFSVTNDVHGQTIITRPIDWPYGIQMSGGPGSHFDITPYLNSKSVP